MNKPAISRRKSIRFKPGQNTLCLIEPEPSRKAEFRPTLFALVQDESATGCGVVALSHEKLLTGENVRVQIGDLAPVMAEIRWRSELGQEVIRLGLMYLSEED